METFKICVLGDAGVGKTELLKSLCNDKLAVDSSINIFATLWEDQTIEFMEFKGHSKYKKVRELFY